jgi:Rrf2 family protein
MLSLTRKADYALVALAFLAQERQRGEGVVSARRIADQFGLPLPLLMNILKELTRFGMVISTRGPQGGYTLACEPRNISVGRVVAAMEGPARLAACCSDAAGEGESDGEVAGSVCPVGSADDAGTVALQGGCAMADSCPIHAAINRLHQRLNRFLDHVTLADMIETRVEVTVEHAAG